jgi:hypothetical protein
MFQAWRMDPDFPIAVDSTPDMDSLHRLHRFAAEVAFG